MALVTKPTFVCMIVVFMLLVSLCSSEPNTVEAVGYDYGQGHPKGPEQWGKINPDWKLCSDGKSQSPIDIQSKSVKEFSDFVWLQTEYKPASAVLTNRGHDLAVVWKEDAGKLILNGTDYNLLHCHWHTPSEHKINGKQFIAELHMVHESSKGERVVIAVLYEFVNPDSFLTKLLPFIEIIKQDDINLGKVDASVIQFDHGRFYKYIGSLTTPPCTEGVIWIVIKKVENVSIRQIVDLKQAVGEVYNLNARPLQKIEGRTIWDSELITSSPPQSSPPQGDL
ncbi:hypothetical protein PIB30_026162 [Stylosanthes scabra]|uniref:Carbonic anhydrase n=1 Tax=Stylosanthes scabra TaxID=79078 RepID=A0ABU6WBE2_9FABA|nr:hypothetical protein [Stylosanthes scabra]